MDYRTRIIGTGSHFPEKIWKNSDFESFLDTSDEWIRTRTGIHERHLCDPAKGETTLSLSIGAVRKAIAMADLAPSDIDLIIVGTVTPEMPLPSTATLIQADIGAKNAFCFDIQAACSGFLYCLSIADQYIRSGAVKNAVIVGVETLSTVMNWKDRSTVVLFGDGAGAAVLQRTEGTDHAVLTTKLRSDGTCAKLLTIPHGGSRVPPYSPEYRASQHKILMSGSEVFKIAVRSMVECGRDVLKENNFSVEDIDYFFFHQANIRIIESCMKLLHVPPEKTWTNVGKYGNTSAATLPVCLDEAWRNGAVKPGDLILMAAFGGGLTWGSSLIRL